MNLPNKLTMARVIMIPFFVIFMLTGWGGEASKWIPAWIVIVIISREFIISGFRLIASDNGRVIAASYWGKFKTTFQMVMICLMIANIEALSVLTTIVMWVALVLTVVSLVDYLMKNKDVLKDQH